VKHYYKQSLASDPDNPRAWYGLASVALEQGETEMAKQYAIRCHAALVQSEDGVIKPGLLELLAKHWPDVVAS
jgi:Tfp pilus assembly protein PilF